NKDKCRSFVPKEPGLRMTVSAMVNRIDLRAEFLQSVAKDLALCISNAMRDSASPAAPQNDSPDGFSRSL
ncbi:MAG: hypothetical protein ABSF14_01250, partial [Terriglobia bacterium]